jgi:hypothetical protein
MDLRFFVSIHKLLHLKFVIAYEVVEKNLLFRLEFETILSIFWEKERELLNNQKR